MLFYVCRKSVESKFVKLDTSHTGILPPTGECSLIGQVGTHIFLLVMITFAFSQLGVEGPCMY